MIKLIKNYKAKVVVAKIHNPKPGSPEAFTIVQKNEMNGFFYVETIVIFLVNEGTDVLTLKRPSCIRIYLIQYGFDKDKTLRLIARTAENGEVSKSTANIREKS